MTRLLALLTLTACVARPPELDEDVVDTEAPSVDAPGGDRDPVDPGGFGGAPFQDTAAFGTGVWFGGVWRDLDQWSRWEDLVRFDSPWFEVHAAWGMSTQQRFAVQVTDADGPVVDAQVRLSRLGEVAFSARTGPQGRVEVFGGVLDGAGGPWTLDVVSEPYVAHLLNVTAEGDTRRAIALTDEHVPVPAGVEVAFLIDHRSRASTGLDWAIEALPEVARTIRLAAPDARMGMVSVDAAAVERVDLDVDDTPWLATLGGLDPSEGDAIRVGSGLLSVSGLTWSSSAAARVAVVVLDEVRVGEPGLARVQQATLALADQGVRVVGVSLDADPSTGFLLRDLAILTGGTWLFALEAGPSAPTELVGPYVPEPLEDLLARQILTLAGL